MNLYQELHDEMKDMHLNEFEKLRNIYYRCALEFSFDQRWYYACNMHDFILKNKIQYRKIDLSNVKDRLVVCHSYSREVLKNIIPEFTNFNVSLIESIHSYVVASDGKTEWILDATPEDLAHIKCGFKPIGFESTSKKNNYMIDEADKTLGLIYKEDNQYLKFLTYENVSEAMTNLNTILQNSKCKNYFTDANYFLKKYTQKLNTDADTYVNEANGNLKFHKLIYIPCDNKYYDLYKFNGSYKIREISMDEYEKKTRVLTRIQG